jgi:DNA-binding transcriptional ArsR family regulator
MKGNAMIGMYCEREKEHLLSVQRAKEGVLAHNDVEKISKMFQVLADSTRLKIVLALMKGDMCVYHLTDVCDGTESGISHQLRILRDNGIVRARRLGKNMEYSIADNHVREMVDLAITHLKCVEG